MDTAASDELLKEFVAELYCEHAILLEEATTVIGKMREPLWV